MYIVGADNNNNNNTTTYFVCSSALTTQHTTTQQCMNGIHARRNAQLLNGFDMLMVALTIRFHTYQAILTRDDATSGS